MWAWQFFTFLLCSLVTEVCNDKQGKNVADLKNELHDMKMRIDKLQTTNSELVTTNSELVSKTDALINEIKRSGMNHRVHKHKQRHHEKIQEELDEQWTKKQTIQLTGDTFKRAGKSMSDRINERLDKDFTDFKDEIKDNEDLSQAERDEQTADLTAKWDALKKSLTASDKGKGIDVAGGAGKIETALLGILPKISLVFKPSLTITQRVQAGVDIATFLIKFVPSPINEVGTLLLKFASAILGMSIPSTNEWTKLRNEILNGVQDMFDREQFADTSGCLYKIEFIQNILKEFDDPKTMKEREFFSLMLLGGIDLGVTTLGALKWKMEYYRGLNTIMDGRRAIDMAHYYVLLAQARDGLYGQILKFLEVNQADDKTNLQLSSLFFKNTRRVAMIGHKDLFWLDDACCQQKPTHLSALIAFNLPVDKHQGKGKAVDVIKKFIADHRTQEYYDNDVNGMSVHDFLSVDDTSNIHKTGRATMKKKKNPLDGNHWYRFQNVYDTTKYIGVNNNEVKVGYWSRTGVSFTEKAGNKMRGVAQRLSRKDGKLVCKHDGSYVYHMGITMTFHSSKLKINFPDPDEAVESTTDTSSSDENQKAVREALTPDERGGLEAIDKIGNKDKDTFMGEIEEIEGEYTENKKIKVKKYIVASRDGVKLAVEKGTVSSVDATVEGSKIEVEKSEKEEAKKIAQEMDQQRKPWDMFVLCKEAEDDPEDPTMKEKLKVRAKLKVFPVKMPGWDETRYIVVPGEDVMGKDITAFGYDQWGTGTFTKAHIESNKVTIPPAEQNKEKDTLTEDMLKEDRWKKLFFTVPYSSNKVLNPNAADPKSTQEIEVAQWSAVVGNTGETHESKATCRPARGHLEGIIEDNDKGYIDRIKLLLKDFANRWHTKFLYTYTSEECVAHCLERRKTNPYIEGMVWASTTELELKECYCMKGVTQKKISSDYPSQYCIFVGEKVTYDIAKSGKCASVSKMQCSEIARNVRGFDEDKNWNNGNIGDDRKNRVVQASTSGCTFSEKDGKMDLDYNFAKPYGYQPNTEANKADYNTMLSLLCSETRPCVCAPGTVGQNFKSLGCWEEKDYDQQRAVPAELVRTDAGVNHEVGTKKDQTVEQWRPENDINECYKLAVEYGYDKFALSDGHRCGGVIEEDYKKHGPMDTCASGVGSFHKRLYYETFDSSDPKFPSLANDVYEILDQSVIQRPRPTRQPQGPTYNNSYDSTAPLGFH